MQFLLGVIVGAVGAAVYQLGPERVRDEIERLLGRSPETLGRTATQTLASATSEGAQRVAEVIDNAPLPDAFKKPASDTAFNVWSTAESHREASGAGDTGEPGSEQKP